MSPIANVATDRNAVSNNSLVFICFVFFNNHSFLLCLAH